MRAVTFDALGGPEVLALGEAPDLPPPRPHEVTLAVRAVGVNFADTMFTRGQYFMKPKLPDVPGMEAAGEVVAVGEAVTSVKPGDRVMALGARAFAERMTAHEGSVYPMPADLSFEKGAALPIQGLTAHHLLFLMGRLQPGERVLVHAAAGGVGALAVQLAKAHGATVVASASPTKHDFLRALGADFVIDSRGELTPQVKASGDVDLILEMIGGTESYKRNLACMRPFARMIVFGAASKDTRGTFEPVGLMGKNLTVSGYYLTPLLTQRALCAPPLADLAGRAARGDLRVETTTFPFADARAAFEALESRTTTGKVVLVPVSGANAP
jgi:NADPH2:quinone reductase